MKTNIQRFFSLFLCAVMIFSSSISAMATTNNIKDSNIREPLEREIVSDEVLTDSLELEHGTMYLEENSEYRIAYIVYEEGYISYSICYKDNLGVAHTGYYYPNEQKHNEVDEASDYIEEAFAAEENIVNILLNLDTEETIDFTSRLQTRATILTEEDALNFAANYASGWKTPVNSRLIGQSGAHPVTVKLYEHVNGYCNLDNIVNYYINDTLVSIASIAFKFNLTKLKNVITNVFDGVRDYVAQKNGTLTYFTIDNTRTKTARINGDTYYWAGWDKEYCVYSGDKATKVEQTYNFAHSDYNESITYFAQKAYDNYINSF